MRAKPRSAMKYSTEMIGFVLAFLTGLTLWELPAFDPDLGWQLFGGAWILDHHAVPRTDPINAFNVSWLDYHWLAQIAFYKLFSWGGFKLLQVALGVGMGLFVCLLFWTALRSARSLYPALIATGGSFLLLKEIAQVRPQMVSLFLVATAQLMFAARAGVRTKQNPLPHVRFELFILFFITILLVNIHVYWLYIPVLWFLYRVLPRARSKFAPSSTYAWGGLFLLGAAPLVSPYGLLQSNLNAVSMLQNYLLIMDYLDIPQILKTTVQEFHSAFALENYRVWVCVAYLAYVAHSIDRAALKRRLPECLNCVLALVLCVRGAKYIGLLAVFSVPYVAWSLRGLFAALSAKPWFFQKPLFQNSLLSVGCLVGLTYSTYYFPFAQPENKFIDTVEPYEICSRLPDLKDAGLSAHKKIRILTHFNHGGWCRFALYERDRSLDWRVTTDNRTQGVPAYHYEKSFELFGLRGEWAKTLETWNPNVAVVSKNMPLATYMALAKGAWKMVDQDDVFAVFVPVKDNAP